MPRTSAGLLEVPPKPGSSWRLKRRRPGRGPAAGAPPTSRRLCPRQALPYVALLIVMLFFIYAVIGMQVRPAPSPHPLTPAPPSEAGRVTGIGPLPPPPRGPGGAQLSDPLSPLPLPQVPPSLGKNSPKLCEGPIC